MPDVLLWLHILVVSSLLFSSFVSYTRCIADTLIFVLSSLKRTSTWPMTITRTSNLPSKTIPARRSL
ncbi:hypothetical protein K466DRAFT_115918 [Polyporus arcularius HHB13444]|uniref:Uncharacterized protein n=1 Tax=Polyporus arcularius HHB13444 TaxID=1314778 RepID=A0A5C3PDM5_9APHY|nr:hypothetical protein K466DRAFT_115918 [Polyporus arcularius HHB13444]